MNLENTEVPLHVPQKRTGIYNIWRRNFLQFGRFWSTNFFWILFEPLVILNAIGFGLGAYISNIQGVSYLDFFFPGFICVTAMTVSFFEATYGNFSKLTYQNTYASMVQTPLEPEDVVLGESLWAASKGSISALGVAVIMFIFGNFEIAMLIPALLVIFLSSFIFAASGMYVISVVKNYDGIIYPTCGFIVPMSVLSGTYFPLEQLPTAFKYLFYAFPLTHTVAVVRGLFLGGVVWWEYVIHLLVLILMAAFFLKLANRNITKKLIH